MEKEKHYINRVGWLRAGVLGANDGILSTTSLVIGVAAASVDRNTLILTALSGLIAGAMSMAAGEYISVSSQLDTEHADIARERKELEDLPEQELEEIIAIYVERGLTPEVAKQVAIALTEKDSLGTHLRDELGMTEISEAKPIQAALASFSSFIIGALLPFLVAVIAPLRMMIFWQYGFSIFFLLILGSLAAKAGGSSIWKSAVRIAAWGTLAMLAAAFVGHIFGISAST